MDYAPYYGLLRHDYYANVANNYLSVGPSCGGMGGLSKRERGETSDIHHHGNNNNNTGDDGYLKPSFCKRQKINIVEDQFKQEFKAEGHQICSNASSYNFSGFDYSAARGM
ncbi:hypothetical protein LIER_05344 [Lithospermum erythrorhizon]|uniref:Uncharacterized protein n=1 Tax=Lithospermum erythrorhizon TaxID=34254 RepID=A0AAV3P504_LITER